MTAITFSIIIVVVYYIVAATFVAVNYVKNQKKEIYKKYEDKLNENKAVITSQFITIEDQEIIISALRLRVSRCSTCRMDTALLVADLREQFKTKKEE